MCSSLCPRTRGRATMRACATAAVLHSPLPSTSGMTPSRAQRRSVAGDTPTRSAASFRETLSATAMDCAGRHRATAEWKGSLRRCMRGTARVVGRRRRTVTRSLQNCWQCCARRVPSQMRGHPAGRLLAQDLDCCPHTTGGSLNYFVTGATGFIGRHLVAELLKREGTIYALVREGSRGKLDALAQRLDAPEGKIVPVAGDLSKPGLGIEDFAQPIDHLFHLAAVYDIEADEEASERANVEGTQHVIEFANAHEVGRFHHTSSIAVAGNYEGVFQEDMFDEGQKLPHHYHRTKYESERLVREGVQAKTIVFRPGIVVGHSETGEMDKIDGPYYFFKLIRRIRNAVPQWMPMLGVEGREINIVPVDFVARARDHIAPLDDLDGRAFPLTDPNPLTAGEVIDTFARAAHGPQSPVRVPARAVEAAQPLAG